jgi:hypothetical protein
VVARCHSAIRTGAMTKSVASPLEARLHLPPAPRLSAFAPELGELVLRQLDVMPRHVLRSDAATHGSDPSNSNN